MWCTHHLYRHSKELHRRLDTGEEIPFPAGEDFTNEFEQVSLSCCSRCICKHYHFYPFTGFAIFPTFTVVTAFCFCHLQQYHMLPWKKNRASVYSGRIPHSYFLPPEAEARIIHRFLITETICHTNERAILQTICHTNEGVSLRQAKISKSSYSIDVVARHTMPLLHKCNETSLAVIFYQYYIQQTKNQR